jgi:hypothetical protein
MPEWKQNELLEKAKTEKQKYEILMSKTSANIFICDVCGKPCKTHLGLYSHKKAHQ